MDRSLIEDYADKLISDKGGEQQVTAVERHLVELAKEARGAQMLIWSEIQQSGCTYSTGKSWDLAPGAKELAKFMNLERQALQAFGFERLLDGVLYGTIFSGVGKLEHPVGHFLRHLREEPYATHAP